ncbi:substrate-binding domain-containing protein [Nonomuraea wenchangensis]
MARHDASDHYDRVVNDDRAGAALAVEHLAALGHRRITHLSHNVSGPGVLSPHAVREAGYREAMRRLGLDAYLSVVTCGGSEAETCRATAALLDRGDPPTALFVGSDQGAFGSLRALSEHGLRVPDDVSVVGYDDTQFASHPRFSLTTVAQYGTAMGRVAAELAVERIKVRKEAREWVSQPALIERESTGPVRLL